MNSSKCYLIAFFRTKPKKPVSARKSPRKGKVTNGNKVVVKTEPVCLEYTFETLEEIRYFFDVKNAFQARKDFEEKNPNTPCRIGTYLTRKEANDEYDKYRTHLVKISNKMLKKPPSEVIVLDDTSGSNGNDDDDDETIYSAEVVDVPDKKKSKEMDKKLPAVVSPASKIDHSQLDNHLGIFYVLFTMKELFVFSSMIECHVAFENFKRANKDSFAFMMGATEEKTVQEKYKKFLKDPSDFLVANSFPKTIPAKRDVSASATAIWKQSEHADSEEAKKLSNSKMPASPRIVNPYTASMSSIMPAKQHISSPFSSAWLENGSFKVDPVLIAITQEKISMEIYVLHPGEIGVWDGPRDIKYFMVILDLLNITGQFGEKPASFWLFKSSIFQYLKKVKSIPGVKTKALFSMKSLKKRAQPFGESKAMVHANRSKPGSSFDHEILAAWVMKSEDVPVDKQVQDFLDGLAEDIMKLAFQDQFYKLAFFAHPKQLYVHYKPLDQQNGHEVTQSFWVHLFAGLKNPKIMYRNRLQDILVDEEIHDVIPRFFTDSIEQTPSVNWTIELQEFAYGEDDEDTYGFF